MRCGRQLWSWRPAASSGRPRRPLAQDPDVIFKKSTVWRALTPDDKLVVYGIDDPVVEGVACHYTTPERGGISGTIGVAEEVSDISLACRQVGPVRFKEKFEQGARRLQRAALAHLQAHADRAGLRRQAQHAGLPGLFRPPDRGLAEELDLERAAHALGHRAGRRAAATGSRAEDVSGCRSSR